MTSRARIRSRLILAGVLASLATPADAQSTWSFDVGFDVASISSNRLPGQWHTTRLQIGHVDTGVHGWFLAVERQQRGTSRDGAIGVSGYRRAGDWTIGGGVGTGVSPTFLYRRTAEAELSRRLFATTVASAGYRVLSYAQGMVHQVQPAVSWHHARGEVQARMYVTRRAPLSTTVTGVISTWVDPHPRVRLSALTAYGDRIFDVASLITRRAPAVLVSGRGRVEVVRHHFIEIGGSVAHEAPAFDYRSIGLTYRRTW